MSGPTAFPASAIISGVLDPARLGSGTPTADKVLYGDGSWGSSNPFDQSLNTTDTVQFDVLRLGSATGPQLQRVDDSTLSLTEDDGSTRAGMRTGSIVIGGDGTPRTFSVFTTTSLTRGFKIVDAAGLSLTGNSTEFGIGTDFFHGTIINTRTLNGTAFRLNRSVNSATGNLFVLSEYGVDRMFVDSTGRAVFANGIEQRNGLNPQAFYVYNTYTSDTDYERGGMWWDNDKFRIGTEADGTGQPRDSYIVGGDLIFGDDGSARSLVFLQPESKARRGVIGVMPGSTSYITFQNATLPQTFGNSALNQSFQGTTTVNAAPGQKLYLRINNGNALTINSDKTVTFHNVPTSDPSVAGQLWNDGGTLKISAG